MANEESDLIREARTRVERAIHGLTRSGVEGLCEAAEALEAGVSALKRLKPDGVRSRSGELGREIGLLKGRLILAMTLHTRGRQFYSGLARVTSIGTAEYTRDGVVPKEAPGAGTLTITG